jgi:hypothetical protein
LEDTTMDFRSMSENLMGRRSKFWGLGLIQALYPVLLLTMVGWAPAVPRRAPVLPPPPQMPAQFDEATVRHLIDTADQGQNAIILKIGYFMNRIAHPFATTNGLAVIKDAITKDTVGSKRWFVLQSIRGFAGFRIAPTTRDESYEAYDALFGRVDDAEKSGAVDVLQRAVLEYASTVYGEYGTHRYGVGPSKEILLKAFNAHLKTLLKAEPGDFYISWSQAIEAVGGGDEFTKAMQARLDDAQTPKSYLLLRTAADIFAAADTPRAIELLRQAKPLLPKGDMEQATSLYKTLVKYLVQLKKWDEASVEQAELVRLTGYGREWLVYTQGQKGNDTGLDATLASLTLPNADDGEINDAAKALLNVPYGDDVARKKVLTDKAIALLKSYLQSNRKRDLEQELRARYRLGQIYVAAGDPVAAKAVLTVAAPTGTESNVVKAYFSRIQQLLQSLNGTRKTP